MRTTPLCTSSYLTLPVGMPEGVSKSCPAHVLLISTLLS